MNMAAARALPVPMAETDAPASFVHQSLRTRVVAKPGAADELGSELAKLGCRRPLLLCSGRTARGVLAEKARKSLHGLSFLEMTDIPPHSSLLVVDAAARLTRERAADALVAIGGGSVSDTAKATALLLAEGGPLERHASRFIPPDTVITPDLTGAKLPILSIPLTASGAEVTPSLGIRTAEGTKLLFWDAQLASRVILLDPVANLEVPAAVMLSTAMNGLAHCIEGLYSKARSPMSSILALDGVVRFDRAMRHVARSPDSSEARAELLLAAHISGMVLATARSCLHHAICHVVGATSGAAHGAVNSAVLPHAVRFNAPFAENLLAEVAQRLGLAFVSGHAGEALAGWIEELQRVTGVPSRLRDLGIVHDGLHALAGKVMHERGLAYNPRPVAGAGELESILAAAW